MALIIGACVVGLLLMASNTPAQAASAPKAGYKGFVSSTLGGPRCEKKRQSGCTSVNLLRDLIAAVPCASKEYPHPAITGSLYSTSFPELARDLAKKASKSCGVDVFVVGWIGRDSKGKEVKTSGLIDLVKAVDKQPHGKGKLCHGSCADNGLKGTNHLKWWSFYDGKKLKRVLSSSGNPTYATNRNGANDDWLIDDTAFYNASVDWIRNKLSKDKKVTAPKRVVGSSNKGRLLYFTPTKGIRDPFSAMIRSAKASKGCVIYNMQYMTTTAFESKLDDLRRLRKAGCEVRMVFNENHLTGRLLRELVSAGVKVKSAQRPKKAYRIEGSHAVYIHLKAGLALGVKVNGKKTSKLFAGGTPDTKTSWVSSTNATITSVVPADIKAAKAYYDKYWNLLKDPIKYGEVCGGKNKNKPGCKK